MVPPLLLRDKISVGGCPNSTRWMFRGTRKKILKWMRHHAHLVIENTSCGVMPPTDTEIVFDLRPLSNWEQSALDYIRSFFGRNYEHVICEIRPREGCDKRVLLTKCRLISRSCVRLGDVVDILECDWYRPGPSLCQRVIDLFMDNPCLH